ncbi:MAG: hypothetical protein JKY46_03870 [Robiginitomaculum sp.]|nr:hypothetical protein [Robiginitomaculum sp.]
MTTLSIETILHYRKNSYRLLLLFYSTKRKMVMQNTRSNPSVGLQDDPMPVLSANDAANYLSELLPQMENIARKSGLDDVADLIVLAESLTHKSTTGPH